MDIPRQVGPYAFTPLQSGRLWTVTGPREPAATLLPPLGAHWDRGLRCWWLTKAQAERAVRKLAREVDPLFRTAGLQL